MASEPDNCSQDVTANSFIDFDSIVFSQSNFYYKYAGLTLSGGNGPLNTPEFERTNPFVPSTPESYIDSSNKPSVPSGLTDEEIVSFLLETQTNHNEMDNDSDQRMDAHAQKTMAEIENDLRNAMIEMSGSMEDLQAVVAAMNRYPNSIMRMGTEPISRQRFRYRVDRRRYLKGSRANPMSIHVLPRLDGCLTKAYQSFWIEHTLVTTRNNPQQKVLLHQHEMTYNDTNAQQNGLGSVRTLLTDEDIRRGIKTFRYLSIIKTKLEDYRFELIPFDPLIADDNIEYYTVPDENELTKVQKSKLFDLAYHTDEYQIVSQLVIKQKDQWYPTDRYCITRVITDT